MTGLIPISPETIPPFLKDLPHWVVFRVTPTQGGRLGKMPLIPGTDRPASISDPTTWRSFDDAMADAERRGLYPGIAITDTMRLTVIDIDGQIDHPLIADLNSYSEHSISGTGIHILVSGLPPANATKPAGVEVYPGRRFLVMTGNLIDGRGTVHDRSEELGRHFSPRPTPTRPVAAIPLTDDDEVITRCRRMGGFGPLYDQGDLSAYGNDRSSADLGLLNYFVVAGITDPDQLDQLFRTSALYRDKWEREDYRRRTIERSLDGRVVPFDGWLRFKNSVVAGKPQDAEHLPGDVAESLAVTGTDGLPSDIPSLKQIIRDLTRRVEAAEHRAQVAELRAHTAEQKVETLALLQSRTASIIKNKALGQERFTAVALSHRFAHLESVGAPGDTGLHPITLASVADVAGVSEDAASRHIGKLVDSGVLRKEVRWIPAGVDPETGEITEGHKRQYLGLAGGNVIDFVEAVATLKPEQPKRWGGRADRCRPCIEHPNAAVIKRVTFHCAECDQVLGQLPDELHDPAGPNPQDADHQPASVPHIAASEENVVTSLRSRTARFSHNGADLDTEGTTVAAAWTRGQSLPGMDAPPPDYRTDVAYRVR